MAGQHSPEEESRKTSDEELQGYIEDLHDVDDCEPDFSAEVSPEQWRPPVKNYLTEEEQAELDDYLTGMGGDEYD
jgi:hypothetical protein